MSGVLSGSISVFDGSIIPIPACQEAEVFTLETNRGERETKIEMRVSKERMQVVALRQDCGKMSPAEQHDGIGGRRQHSPAIAACRSEVVGPNLVGRATSVQN